MRYPNPYRYGTPGDYEAALERYYDEKESEESSFSRYLMEDRAEDDDNENDC